MSTTTTSHKTFCDESRTALLLHTFTTFVPLGPEIRKCMRQIERNVNNHLLFDADEEDEMRTPAEEISFLSKHLSLQPIEFFSEGHYGARMNEKMNRHLFEIVQEAHCVASKLFVPKSECETAATILLNDLRGGIYRDPSRLNTFEQFMYSCTAPGLMTMLELYARTYMRWRIIGEFDRYLYSQAFDHDVERDDYVAIEVTPVIVLATLCINKPRLFTHFGVTITIRLIDELNKFQVRVSEGAENATIVIPAKEFDALFILVNSYMAFVHVMNFIVYVQEWVDAHVFT